MLTLAVSLPLDLLKTKPSQKTKETCTTEKKLERDNVLLLVCTKFSQERETNFYIYIYAVYFYTILLTLRSAERVILSV